MALTKDVFLWLYWNPFKILIQSTPPRFTYAFGKLLASLLHYGARSRRRRLKRELDLLFDHGMSYAAHKKVIIDAFRIWIFNELEVFLFPILNEKNISDYVTCSGLDYLDKALAAGKGALLLFAHFGANQMVMPAIGYNGYEMCQLSAPATAWKTKLPGRKFSKTEERAMETRGVHELSLPVKHVNIFGSLKGAFLCLKNNGVLGVAVDGGSGKDRVVVDFLDRKAAFSIGAVDIARRTGCTILPTFMLRDKSGHNRMIIEAPLELEGGGDPRDTITKTTQRFVKRLEEYVLAYPSYYLNFLALRTFMAERGDTPLFQPSEE